MREDVEKATHSMLGTLSPMNNQYGGMYRGTVLNNDDPKHRGRCKIFIPGVYNDEFADEDGKYLPWAEPSQPLFCGGIEKNGTFQCPDLGSTVWCFFESNDTARPVFFGQTTDAQGYFDTDHCRIYWDGMFFELEKSTHTATVSAENIKGDAGKDVVVNAGGKVNVTASDSVTITSPTVTINGDVTINGTATISGLTTIGGSAKIDPDAVIGGKSFLGHIHLGNMGASTSPPIG